MKFSDPKGDQKIEVSSQGTYMAQNSMSKTSTILLCITKGSSKIYQIEIKLWLSEVLQKHQSSIMFIHSVISENDKNVPLIVCDFHMK